MSDIDFRKRCAVEYEISPGVVCEKIFYGLTAAELGDGGHGGYDLQPRYDSRTIDGRRRVGADVVEAGVRHFYRPRL